MANNTQVCRNRILNYLAGKTAPVRIKELSAKTRGRRVTEAEFRAALRSLSQSGEIIIENERVSLPGENEFAADVVRLSKTFGFVKDEKGTEYFVPGRFLKGAVPGDKVICSPIPPRGEAPEAQILSVAAECDGEFPGVVEVHRGRKYFRSDALCRDPLEIAEETSAGDGDKVTARIVERGEHHRDHRCVITAVFGSCEEAANCARTLLYSNDIEVDFPLAVKDEAAVIGKKKITARDLRDRLDLRDETIFTIDGADTKDIDDAISVERTASGYRVGVHIADVSHYVKPGSALDRDAFIRGTSIYYADKVIPMLPKELSNGICSLNPGEDRLAFSCLMDVDSEGNVTGHTFAKSVIRSRVKGVYSEINPFIETGAFADPQTAEKYAGLEETIRVADELTRILWQKRRDRGAPEIHTTEVKHIIDEEGRCIGIEKRASGRAEELIEDLMLLANECAAKTAKERELPFVYRVHEDPSPEKVQTLVETVEKLGLPHQEFKKIKPLHMAQMLRSAEDRAVFPIVNMLVLRSMAKARYDAEPIGHFGLALADYAHFTSPIRRYPDLAVHRILTESVYNKKDSAYMSKKYGKFAHEAAIRSSECELAAMKVERDCDDCYTAEYMRSRIGDEFEGMICSVLAFGLYVELDNGAEGLIKTESLEGMYEFDGEFSLRAPGRRTYTIGDRIRVQCVGADVNSGNIDLIISE
ncbi:MAG: ribonuclease R [Oscillospiraceae bacterium]|nr:ribonuclease R [Oscillospiraceae bacterium]